MMTREEFDSLKKLIFFKGRVASSSMSPVLEIGDQIVVKIGAQDLKRFDIVVIWLEGRPVCHYLWRKNEIVKPILLQTRNMSGHHDYPVSLDDYLGKVVSHRLSFWQKIKSLL